MLLASLLIVTLDKTDKINFTKNCFKFLLAIYLLILYEKYLFGFQYCKICQYQFNFCDGKQGCFVVNVNTN